MRLCCVVVGCVLLCFVCCFVVLCLGCVGLVEVDVVLNKCSTYVVIYCVRLL